MPKNKGKGGKNRRRGKNDNEGEKRELLYKEEDQEAHCFDGVKRLCHIRGKMRKRVWINSGDIILVSLRDYQDSKADVIAKYTPDEARSLKAHGELPETAKINETDIFDDDGQNGVEFLDDESDEEAQEEMNNARRLDIEDVNIKQENLYKKICVTYL
ncbi:translation initiation factor eIF-1A [Plasmodium falciparum IGH-CR14]|uniref:Translation initiation factor eIF-1A n=1 Tax=Plasmodium falciparum IGH-CR14 TaxID=580059 RepID=A0A0L1I8P1_PLAFA|nr:translation initiation factor eIF-1A [Plasmodium falciparum IGH-CR14]